MNMKVEEVHPTRGVHVTHDGYVGDQRKRDLKAKRFFIPPNVIR